MKRLLVAIGCVLSLSFAAYADEPAKTPAAPDAKPLFPLKNPGIVSIPLGFIAAILAALAFPSKKAEEMWNEVYVRQNTGLGMAKAIDH